MGRGRKGGREGGKERREGEDEGKGEVSHKCTGVKYKLMLTIQ